MSRHSEDRVSTLVSSDGTTIAYATRGLGPGLVVLSGAVVPPGGYEALVAALAGSSTVHYVHRRGRGDSGPQGSGYSIDKEAQDVLAVLERTGATAVFGHSFGGLLALQTALQDRDGRIERLVAYEPAASIDGMQPSDYLPAFARAVDRRHRARALTILQRSLHVGGPLDRLPAPAGVLVNAAVLGTVGRGMRETLSTVPAEAREAVRLDGPASDYSPIAVPTLIMVGERSAPWLVDGGSAIAAGLPRGELAVMAGLDHNGPLLKAAPVAARLTEFLNGATARPAR